MLFEKFLLLMRRYLPELFLLLGIAGIYLYIRPISATQVRPSASYLIVFVAFSFLGLFMMMYNYLQRSKGKLSSSIYEDSLHNVTVALEKVAKRYTHIDKRIDDKFEQIGIILDKNLQKEAIVNFQPAQRDEIYSKVSSTISENINSTFFESLKEQLQEKIIADQRVSMIQ